MTPDDSTQPPATPYASQSLNRVSDALRAADHPRQLGRYHIIELIGEGGMGAVYKAEQRTPLQRTVAVKVIKLGMDTRQVVARFEAERQALALMDHPNVARVIDGGATADGRPYFVMEYVHGEPITAFADGQSLTLEQRLVLFRQACDAIQHAHQKAIIHRDLKPSNILVTTPEGRPWVKVIDFGVAKAIDQRLTDTTVLTESGQLIGTLEYMSPEQADGRLHSVDTRSDVYSLGVVLYELLAGAVPFDAATLRTAGYQEIQRIICSVDPPRPSTRLSALGQAASTIADRRRTALDALSRQLHRELDWIPLKAMRKDPAERYATAAELSEDIGNYLAQRPLRAGPESAMYRARKFLRRNKAGVAAAAGMVMLLLCGIIATTWQAIRATRAEHVARDALKKSQEAMADTRAVNDFLTLDILWSAEPVITRGRELSVREAMDNAARDVGTRFMDRPRIEAQIRSTLAGAYRTLGELEVATSHAQAAVEIVDRLGIAEEPDGIQIRNDRAMIFIEQGKPADAELVFRQTLASRRRVLGNDHVLTMESLGNLVTALLGQGKTAEADPLLQEQFDMIARGVDRGAEPRPLALDRLAAALQQGGRFAEAEQVLREAVEISQQTHGPDHPFTLKRRGTLAHLYRLRGDLKQAEPMLDSLLSDERRVLGDDHPETISTLNIYAILLADRGMTDEALPLAEEAMERRVRVFGPEHMETLECINNLARIHLDRQDYAAAEPLFRRAVEISRQRLGDEHGTTLAFTTNLGFMLFRLGRFDEAESIMRSNLAILRRTVGVDAVATMSAINNLGGLLNDRGQLVEAEAMYREALELRRRNLGDGHNDTLGALSNLARAIRSQDRHADAEPLFAELYRSSAASQLPTRQSALYMSHWGPCLVKLGRMGEAEGPLIEAHRRLTESAQTQGEHMRRVLSSLAEVCDHAGRSEAASRWRDELAAVPPQPATAPAPLPVPATQPRS